MSKQDSETLNTKCHISALCKSFGYDAMVYKRWFDHGLVLDADNCISISDFNAFIKEYLTKDEDLEQLKIQKLKTEIETNEIKNAALRGEYYSKFIVDSTIQALFKITKDRVLQLDKTTQRVHSSTDQQQAKLVMKEISREILSDIESGITTLAQDMQTQPQQQQQQINSTDNNNKESAQNESTTTTPATAAPKRRGRPKSTS